MSMGEVLQDVDLALQIVEQLGAQAAPVNCLDSDLLARFLQPTVRTEVRQRYVHALRDNRGRQSRNYPSRDRPR